MPKVAAHSGLELRIVARIIADLVARGAVARSPPRSRSFSLTPRWHAFERICHEGVEDRLRAFTALLDADENFVRDADEYRLSRARAPARLAALAHEHEDVAARASAVMEALRRESGG
ncbi:MAG: hypothetical protein L3J78_01950 [Thermoplasmata archaeon]|nr:hypothetical protein [Thermoplasmata archaeon]